MKFELKQAILDYLRDFPGSRKRTIANGVCCWVCDLAGPIAELEREGLVYCTSHRDYANMEFYDKWYLTEKAVDI